MQRLEKRLLRAPTAAAMGEVKLAEMHWRALDGGEEICWGWGTSSSEWEARRESCHAEMNAWLPSGNVKCIDNSVPPRYANVTGFTSPSGVK